MARALLLTIVGVFACGAILAATIVIVVHGALAGAPLDRGDWISVAIFGGLSAVVLAIALLASRRAWRAGKAASEASRWVARVAPVLALGGVVLGAIIGFNLSRGHVRAEEEADRWDCERVLGEGRDDAQLSACRPLARACRHASWSAPGASAQEQEAELRRWPVGLRLPPSRTARLAGLCLIDRLRERGQSLPRPR